MIYLFSGFISKGIGLMMLPIFTNYLTPHDFGQINILSNFTIIITPFIYLSILQTISSDFFKLSAVEFKKVLSSLVYLPIICTVIIVIISLPFSSSISEYFRVFEFFIILAPIFVLGNFYTELILVLLRNYERQWSFFWYILLKVLLETLVSLILVLLVYNNLWGRIWGIAIGSLFSLPIAFVFLRKKVINFSFDKKIVRDEFFFAIPMIINQFALSIFSTSDKFFLAKYVSISELGAYSVAYQLCYVIVVISNSYYTFIAPKFFAALSKQKISLLSLATKSFKVFIFVNGLICLFTFFFSGFIYKLMIGKSFSEGQKYLSFILLGLFFWSITNPLFSIFYFYKQKKLIGILSIVFIIINLGLNYLFVTSIGGIGIAISTSVFYCLLFFTVIYIIRSILEKKFYRYAS